MNRTSTQVLCTQLAAGAAILLLAATALLAPAPATAEVVRNTGGGDSAVNDFSVVCSMDLDYNADKAPDVDPLIVVGIGTKDDTGGFNPARIRRIVYDNGVDPLITINRGDLFGLTPAHEELDNLQVNRLELWALPFLPVPATDQGIPLRIRITFIDENDDVTSVSDVITGCALFNGVSQVRPVTGHGGGDVGVPGTDFPFSFLPCSVDGMAADAVLVNGDMGITGPALDGQISALDISTGGSADDLNGQSSHRQMNDENCGDGFTFMAWQLDQATTWVTAALTLEPEEDCNVQMELDGDEFRAGDPIAISFALKHNRWQEVTVPILFWIEDALGNRVLDVVTAPRTFEHGDIFRRTFRVRIPSDLAPGTYTLAAGAERMQQGLGWVSQQFTVVDD